MVAHICNPSTQEAKDDEFKATLGPVSEKKNITTQKDENTHTPQRSTLHL